MRTTWVDACFAAGICGPSCAPPPPAPVCAGGCGGGYGCGQYGCYRLRARVASSKTLRIAKPEREGEGSEGEEERRSLQTPDEKFMACCQERNLPDACISKCTFSTYTRAALQNMYFRADPCPMQAAADMQFCAAQGRDHRQCCARNGVGSTLAGEKCLTFCNQVPGNVTQLDMSYIACYDRFESMKGCFWHDLTRRQQKALSAK
ncbi:DB module domain-containing protein [Ditylenchus destructor]|nr:DB module domain-containing protein [Ditylenchus destructor]